MRKKIFKGRAPIITEEITDWINSEYDEYKELEIIIEIVNQ